MSFEKNTNLAPKVCSVYFEKMNGVQSIVDGTDKFHKVVTFKTGYQWNKIYLSPGTIEFEEPEKYTPSGSVFEQKLTALFPGNDTSNYTDFYNYENYRYIVKLVYNNGSIKVFGDQVNPVRMKKDDSTKQGGSLITLFRNGIDKAYILS